MKLRSLKYSYTLFLLFILGSISAQDDYSNDSELRYEDYVYKPNIKTVQLHEVSWEFSLPLIKFNAGEQLQLSFDYLDGDKKQYSLTLVH